LLQAGTIGDILAVHDAPDVAIVDRRGIQLGNGNDGEWLRQVAAVGEIS